MGKKVSFHEGDLFQLPLSSTQYSIGMILIVSSEFPGSVLVQIYDQLFERDEVFSLDVVDNRGTLFLNYVVDKAFRSGTWPVIGNSQSLLLTTTFPRLRVGASLYYRDQYVGNVSAEDIPLYPLLRVAGQASLVSKLRRHFGLFADGISSCMHARSFSTVDNDDAGSWFGVIEQSGPEGVDRALDTLIRTSDISREAPECAIALAAAEVVAAAGGLPHPNLPHHIAKWARTHVIPSSSLVDKSMQVVDMIANRSELRDLWTEVNAYEEWADALSQLRSRLSRM